MQAPAMKETVKEMKEIKTKVSLFLRKSTAVAGQSTSAFAQWCDTQQAVAFAVRSMAVLHWVREQWPLWGTICSIFAAALWPMGGGTSTLTTVLVAFVFFFSGMSFPMNELRHAAKALPALLFAMLHVFVLSPIVGFVAYALPIWGNSALRPMIPGVLSTMCLPPPTAISIVLTAAASGTESVALCASAIGIIAGMFASPLLIRVMVAAAIGTTAINTSSFLMEYLLFMVLPLVGGQACQFVLLHTAGKRCEDDEEDAMRRSLSTAPPSCTDSMVAWRLRIRVLLHVIMLVLNYCIFSVAFRHTPTGGASPPPLASPTMQGISWDAFLYVFIIMACMHLVLCGVAWTLSAVLRLNAEDRIAVFFSSVQKSEILAAPMLSQMFVEGTDTSAIGLATLVFPALVYHLVQSIVGSILLHPLRRWRNAQHCKPGTTLLPLKYLGKGFQKHYSPVSASPSTPDKTGKRGTPDRDTPSGQHGSSNNFHPNSSFTDSSKDRDSRR